MCQEFLAYNKGYVCWKILIATINDAEISVSSPWSFDDWIRLDQSGSDWIRLDQIGSDWI